MLTVNAIKPFSFHTPCEIQDPRRKTDNRFKNLFLAVGRFADAYLSLSSKKTLWQIGQQQLVQNVNGHQKVFPRTICTVSDVRLAKYKWVSTLVKVIRILSYLLILPPLLALPFKIGYKALYIFPFYSSLQATPAKLEKLAVEDKRQLLTELPLWFESHFPYQKDFFKNAFALQLDKAAGELTQDQVDAAFALMLEKSLHLLTATREKSPLMLKGLQLPQNNPLLAIAASDLLSRAWNKLVQNYDTDNYAWANDVITEDSYNALQGELRTLPQDLQELICREQKLASIKRYPQLKMQLQGPAFTIFLGS